jgi:CMP-2-keto-3-deoxyoctulosonic acid synthetase
MRIDVTIVDTVPVEVNTPDDLERARRIIAG